MYQKGFSNILIIIFGILIGVAAIGLYSSMKKPIKLSLTPAASTPSVHPTPTPAPTPTPPSATACGISVTSPVANAQVGSLITITGSISGQCHWTAFEGQTGTVRAFDANGNPVSATSVLTATSDWMQLPVGFSAKVTINTPPENVATGYLLFMNEDPSGQFPETYQLPIRF